MLLNAYGLLLDVVYSIAFLYRIIQPVVMGCVCQSWIKSWTTYLPTYLGYLIAYLAPEIIRSKCTKVLVAAMHTLFFFCSERLINRWNRIPDSVDFTSFSCFKRYLNTVEFSLLG